MIEPLRRARPPPGGRALHGRVRHRRRARLAAAATGGIDAQDFTEMLLRMYLRWASDRGFKTDVLEASPGERRGPEVGHAEHRRRECLRHLQGRARQAPARPALAVRPGAPAHTSFSQVVVAPLLRRTTPRSSSTRRPSDRHVPRERRRRSAREQDRLGGADHAPPDRDRRAVPERALAVCEQADSPCACSARGSPSSSSRSARPSSPERGEAAERLRQRQHPQLRPPAHQQVKDHRTGHEVGNAQGVLDGDIDGFIHAYLLAQAAGSAG